MCMHIHFAHSFKNTRQNAAINGNAKILLKEYGWALGLFINSNHKYFF